MLEKAIIYAIFFHHNQKDLDGKAYINHLVRVMLSADTVFEKTVAILHDILEDTTLSYNGLEKAFGSDVSNCVLLLTRPQKKEQYETYIERICDSNNYSAIKVKILDIEDKINKVKNKEKKMQYNKALVYLYKIEKAG